MIRSLYAVALLLSLSDVGAVSLEASSLEAAVQRADFIGHVRVTEGKAFFFQNVARNQACGGFYRADVIQALKGEATTLEFGINFNFMLTPGSEYLLFVDFRGGLGIEMIMFEPTHYEECRSELPSTMARWRDSSLVKWELSERGEVRLVSRPYGIRVENIEVSSDGNIPYDEYVREIKRIVQAEAEDGKTSGH